MLFQMIFFLSINYLFYLCHLQQRALISKTEKNETKNFNKEINKKFKMRF